MLALRLMRIWRRHMTWRFRRIDGRTPLVGSQTGSAQQSLSSLSDTLLDRVPRTVAWCPLLVF